MSYYERRIAELSERECQVEELGEEIAIVDGEHILVGGDAPAAYELSGATPEIARRLAELGRQVGEDALDAYEAYLAECGAREVSW
jgi:hypothetical protein